MRHWIFGLVLLGLVAPASVLQAEHTEVSQRTGEGILVVVDRSGSMFGMMGLIRQQVGSLMERLGRKQPAGLIHFSGCGAHNVNYAVPLAEGNADRVRGGLEGVQAGGLTDLAAALTQARVAMEQTGLCPQLALFTDNYDTCGGDPAKAIGENFCLEINVITSTTEVEVVEKLEALSEKGNGQTFFAETDEEVADVLDKIAQKAKTRNKARAQIRASKSGDQGKPGQGPPPVDGKEDGGKKKPKKAPLRKESEQQKEKEEEGN